MGPKYYVNANSSSTIYTGFVIRRGNTWLWDNLIADLVIIEGRFFFSPDKETTPRGHGHRILARSLIKSSSTRNRSIFWSVGKHEKSLRADSQFKSGKARVKSRTKVCSQVYKHVGRRENKRAILSAGNHATVLATEICTFPNATNATVSSEKKSNKSYPAGKTM